MSEWVSVNGQLIPAAEARVSVFDSGFMQGIGLFETMRAYDGAIFRLRAHVERLVRSAQRLGWTVLPDVDDLVAEAVRVVRETGSADARVRLTVTTGAVRSESPEARELTVVLSATPGVKYPAPLYERGVSVIVSPYRHNVDDPTTGHKTTSYFARLASLRAAHARGAMEALWFDHEDYLAEGAISSVFLVKGERLLTPPLETPILPGITRAVVLELARSIGIEVEERPIVAEEALEADEIFLTNSLMELIPVVRIGRDPVGTEKPGEMTTRLVEAYGQVVEEECTFA